MIKYICSEKDHGKKVIRVIQENLKELPFQSVKKAFRKKDIKLNGRWTSEKKLVNMNDLIELYISENGTESKYRILFEDNNILIIFKEAGFSCHDNKKDGNRNLLNVLNRDFDCDIYLCHRLDRNTEGLVLAAKGKENAEFMRAAIRDGRIEKYYMCIADGIMDKKEETLKAYLIKDRKESFVRIFSHAVPGSVDIITEYKVIKEYEDTSLLRIRLHTGRTHQIRAHMAYIGHPIIGDGKYGDNIINRMYKCRYQLLSAYKIKFNDLRNDRYAKISGQAWECRPENLSRFPGY